MKRYFKILGYLSVMFCLTLACSGTWPLATTTPPPLPQSPYQTLVSRINNPNGAPVVKLVRQAQYIVHTAWPKLTTPTLKPTPQTTYWESQPTQAVEEVLFIEPTPMPTPEPAPQVAQISDTVTITPTEVITSWPSQRLNLLLIGADGRNGDTAGRSDTMIVVSIEPLSKTVAMLSMPRDLWLTIPGYSGQRRINSAYRLGEQASPNGGGATLLKATLAHNFGITIDYYAQVNFEGFEKVVNVLGGVEVTVPELINTAAFYGFTPKYINREGHYSFIPANVVAADGKPVQNAWEIVTQTTYITHESVLSTAGSGYKMLYLEPGQHTIDGATALQYARSRAFVSADFVRMQHQQAVLLAMRQKLLQTNMFVHLPDLWAVLQESIKTDLPFTEMLKLGALIPHIQPENIHPLTMDYSLTKDFTTDKGARVLLPQYDKINPLTQQWFGATPITATTSVTLTLPITTTN